jgi:hypothetical protein
MAVNFYTGLGLDCPAKPGGLLLWPWPLALRINIEKQLAYTSDRSIGPCAIWDLGVY